MAKEVKSLREAMEASGERQQGKVQVSRSDAAEREAIARESAIRYRHFVADINRTGDSEMERALLCS
jgi:hypothetical protein